MLQSFERLRKIRTRAIAWGKSKANGEDARREEKTYQNDPNAAPTPYSHGPSP